jgi:hypothetical protein
LLAELPSSHWLQTAWTQTCLAPAITTIQGKQLLLMTLSLFACIALAVWTKPPDLSTFQTAADPWVAPAAAA